MEEKKIPLPPRGHPLRMQGTKELARAWEKLEEQRFQSALIFIEEAKGLRRMPRQSLEEDE